MSSNASANHAMSWNSNSILFLPITMKEKHSITATWKRNWESSENFQDFHSENFQNFQSFKKLHGRAFYCNRSTRHEQGAVVGLSNSKCTHAFECIASILILWIPFHSYILVIAINYWAKTSVVQIKNLVLDRSWVTCEIALDIPWKIGKEHDVRFQEMRRMNSCAHTYQLGLHYF